MTKLRPARDIAFVRPEEWHLASIAARLRQADIDEVWAIARRPLAHVLLRSVQNAAFCRVALIDGVPEIVFGVADVNVLTRSGAPWLLATDYVERNPRLFLRQSRRWLAHFLERYDRLDNLVDAQHVAAVRWLEWLGFTVGPAFPHGVDGAAIRMFEMERVHVR